MRQVEKEIEKEIDALYDAFAAYPLTETAGCSCCVSVEHQAALRSAPLRQLSVDNLERFAFKAMSTWGDDRDYRHFLPRILELAASDASRSQLGFDLGLIARKLKSATFGTWRESERAAVVAWFHAVWTATLADPEAAPRVIEVALAVSEIVPLAELLAEWAATAHTATHVAEAIMQVWSMKQGPDRDALRSWLRDPRCGSELEAAFAVAGDTPIADELARARDQWELLAAEPP